MTDLGALVDTARIEIDGGQLPACQVALARDGELLLFETLGATDGGDRFHLWSCTKALVAAVVWMAVGEGRLGMDQRVAEVIPEFATNGKEVVTVEHLLLHTAGFPLAPLGPAYWSTSEGRRHAFSRWRLMWPPGSRYEYHQLAAHWLLAELLMAVTGHDHRQLVRTRLCEPLGLDRLALGVAGPDQADIVDVVLTGQPATPDDWAAAGLPVPPPSPTPPGAALVMNTAAAREVGIPAGGAVGTAADVALLYQALLHNTRGLWDAGVLADGTGTIRNTHPDTERWGIPANRTRGLVVRGDDDGAHWRMHFGPTTSPATFGHDGAGGQIAWADPATGVSFCYLTNGMEANRVTELLRCQRISEAAGTVAAALA